MIAGKQSQTKDPSCARASPQHNVRLSFLTATFGKEFSYVVSISLGLLDQLNELIVGCCDNFEISNE